MTAPAPELSRRALPPLLTRGRRVRVVIWGRECRGEVCQGAPDDRGYEVWTAEYRTVRVPLGGDSRYVFTAVEIDGVWHRVA